MAKGFTGFEIDLFDFMRELSQNNNREWFNDNKERYKTSVVAPVCDFIDYFSAKMAKIANRIVTDARPHGGSMFRIYRDIRFSKDRRPYKTHIGCHFKHQAGKDAHAPGYYLHLESEKVVFGGGIWKPGGDALDNIRKRIIEKPEEWDKVINNKKFTQLYGGIQGDSLIRPPRGYAADNLHIVDLKRKSFYVMHEVAPENAMCKDFINEVAKTYKDIRPMMQFITEAQGLPLHRA